MDGECPAGLRKAEMSVVSFSETLQHIDHIGRSIARDSMKNATNDIVSIERHHTLVLDKPVLAVEPIPMPNAISRVEERRNRNELPLAQLRSLAIPELRKQQ